MQLTVFEKYVYPYKILNDACDLRFFAKFTSKPMNIWSIFYTFFVGAVRAM